MSCTQFIPSDGLKPHSDVIAICTLPERPGLVIYSSSAFLSMTLGCLQVSAHGTGASIPTVDEMVVSMKLVTPGKGTLEVSRDEDPELFRMAKVGLGALGIVSEVTLQLVPSHKLLEHTYIMSSKVRTALTSLAD